MKRMAQHLKTREKKRFILHNTSKKNEHKKIKCNKISKFCFQKLSGNSSKIQDNKNY